MSRLAIVYHRPFTLADDGSLYEAEGAFSKYVESIAECVEEVVLCVPVRPGVASGHRLTATNVRLCALPFYDALPSFYRSLPRALRAVWRDSKTWTALNVRVPTWFAPYVFAVARLRQVPTFLLVVGDLRDATRAVRRLTWKRRAHRLYVELEERLLALMVGHSLTFCNGSALYSKHARHGARVIEVRTSTLTDDVFHKRGDTCTGTSVQLLCVSRVDPRKGLSLLPDVLAELVAHGHDAHLRIIGPIVGRPGAEEQRETLRRATVRGVGDRVQFSGVATIEEVFAAYRDADLFVLPSLPGEGIPRVLLEAMAACLPVVTTRVAGIPDAIQDGVTGILVEPGSSSELRAGIERLLHDPPLRRSIMASAFLEAHRHSARRHAREILSRVARAYPSLRVSCAEGAGLP